MNNLEFYEPNSYYLYVIYDYLESKKKKNKFNI